MLLHEKTIVPHFIPSCGFITMYIAEDFINSYCSKNLTYYASIMLNAFRDLCSCYAQNYAGIIGLGLIKLISC